MLPYQREGVVVLVNMEGAKVNNLGENLLKIVLAASAAQVSPVAN